MKLSRETLNTIILIVKTTLEHQKTVDFIKAEIGLTDSELDSIYAQIEQSEIAYRSTEKV